MAHLELRFKSCYFRVFACVIHTSQGDPQIMCIYLCIAALYSFQNGIMTKCVLFLRSKMTLIRPTK